MAEPGGAAPAHGKDHISVGDSTEETKRCEFKRDTSLVREVSQRSYLVLMPPGLLPLAQKNQKMQIKKGYTFSQSIYIYIYVYIYI